MTAQEIRTEIDKKTAELFPKAKGDMRDTIISAMMQGALIVLQADLESDRKRFLVLCGELSPSTPNGE